MPSEDTKLIIEAIQKHSPNGDVKKLAQRMNTLEQAVRDIPLNCAIHTQEIKHGQQEIAEVRLDVRDLQRTQGRNGTIAAGLGAIGVVLGLMLAYLIDPIAKLFGKGAG